MSEDATFYKRLAIGAVVLAYMQWGPIAHQLFGQKIGRGMMTWRMYYGAARDVCDVRYYAVDSTGQRTPIDRFEALGYGHFWEAKRAVRRVTNREHIERQGRQICREFLPPGQSLTAEARCASYSGWKAEVFEAPICRGVAHGGPPAVPGKATKGRRNVRRPQGGAR